MPYEVRDATAEDLPAINAIGRAYSHLGGWEINDAGGSLPLHDAECVLTCVSDGRVRGWLYANLPGSGQIVIERVVTDGEYRRRGVGTALINELARRYEDRCLVAGVDPDDRPFYAVNGFLAADDLLDPMVRPAVTTRTCCSFRPNASDPHPVYQQLLPAHQGPARASEDEPGDRVE
ncbi:GNAT family N-acetyltransferase [Streptomyces sp. UH6]|uniref:GNAT family N-acetyltransferase n=1 Tax=Streptomyces sp. UH6 TaxID=2748379 RepID=UPI0015D4ABE4|nr:GNAT family N-acetyltransferase [Streptomyces sp. UH6]NYV73318.1 GNAT family N-acetyltransferase [Streptomyces sp. UH6]